jgi:hypothetical protein
MHSVVVVRFLQVQSTLGQRVFILEEAPEFLQRWSLGFRIQEPDDRRLNREPHNIDDVEPAGCFSLLFRSPLANR